MITRSKPGMPSKHPVNGLEWIEAERFDLSAKLPAGATASQISGMLQAFLL
jgi:uncharacterized protein (TIGR03435 family)